MQGVRLVSSRPQTQWEGKPPSAAIRVDHVSTLMEPDGSLPLVSVMLGYRWMKMKRPGSRSKLSTQVAAHTVAAQAPVKTRKNGPQMLATFSQTFFFLPFTAMQPIVPLLVADNFELSAELWGAVCAAEGAAKIICAMPVATCLISNGRKPVLVAAFLCFGFAMYALAHTNTILGLLGGKLLVGAAVLAQNSGMQLYLTDISTVENKSRVMAPVLMAEKLSSVLGPLIGGKLIHLFGAKMAMSHLAAITFLLGLLNQGMLKETKPAVQSTEVAKPSGKFWHLLKDMRVREALLFSGFY